MSQPPVPDSRPEPSGIVTLLTDFGAQDTYVGIMKGVLWSRATGLRSVVDLTHEIAPQDVRAAAFHLLHAWRWFPRGSVHVAVVDPGVGGGRGILAAALDGHVFLAPDNGLLAPLLAAGARARRVEVERYSLPARSRTFHGRDVFAPTAAALVSGEAFEALGPLAEGAVDLRFPVPPLVDDGRLEAEVLLVDRFGNLITNLPREALEPRPEAWTIEHAGLPIAVRGTYSEAPAGSLLGLIDSYGLLELALRDGNAAAQLNLGVGARLRLSRKA